MLDKKYFQKLKTDYVEYSRGRREVITRSNEGLNLSKRAIFSLHRGDDKSAEQLLNEAISAFRMAEKLFHKTPRLKEEGSYRAGLEEYAEARLLLDFSLGKKIGSLREANVDFEIYLGGLCDFTGELVRRAVNRATVGKYDEVRVIAKVMEAVMAELIECDLTGYLRQKYDQAKNNMRKMEDILYDIGMKS